VEIFIQNQDLNNFRWLCLQECMIQKLPNNSVNYCHLWVFHLTNCNFLQFFFDILNHGLNISICVNMKESSTSFGKLNALLEFNLLGIQICKNYLNLLANWLRFKSLIYRGV
jgi:hypothetical protein